MARKVDDLGRIVLPVEMRRLFGIRSGDALDISVDDRGIVLRKVETRCVFCEGLDTVRAFHGKQLCGACAVELGAVSTPPEVQGDVVDPPAWES